LGADIAAAARIPFPAQWHSVVAAHRRVAAAFNSRITDNIVRVGVNYKFDPDEVWAYY